MSPEKGGVLRTEIRRTFQRSLLIVAGVVLPVAPLTALAASSTMPAVALHTIVAAPAQQVVAAQVTTTTLSASGVVHLLRHLVVLPKVVVPRVVHSVVHHPVVHHPVVHHPVVHHPVVHHPVVHHPVVHPVVHHPVVHRPIWHRPVPSSPKRQRIGIATWYPWHVGQCATSYRPHGTRIWVRDLATNKVITCMVTDTQPYSLIHVVDLNETQFAQLAPLGQGVIQVKVTW